MRETKFVGSFTCSQVIEFSKMSLHRNGRDSLKGHAKLSGQIICNLLTCELKTYVSEGKCNISLF